MARSQFTFDNTDEIRKQLAELLGQFERLTSEPATLVQIGLAHTARIENAKLNSLVRDRAALVAKVGEGDERLAQLDERIAAQRQVGATIESLNARAAAGAPTIQRGGIVHGRVISPAGEAVPKIRVVAVDAKGQKQAEDVTDAAGRYELRIAIAATSRAAEESEKKRHCVERWRGRRRDGDRTGASGAEHRGPRANRGRQWSCRAARFGVARGSQGGDDLL